MKRVFGLVGYACNGKSTIIKKIMNNKDYTFIDLPQIYKEEAYKNGYTGVTEWYTGVGLEKYREESKKAVLNYIDKELPRTKNLIIDDIFDIDVYKRLMEIYPQMKLISFHSKYNDRLKRLSERAGITDRDELIKGLNERDNMKRYCGIEKIFTKCKYEINNKDDILNAKKLFENEIKKNLIICIVGYSGCGKSTICRFISNRLNVPLFEYGKVVTKVIKDNGYNKSREYVNDKGIDSYIELIEPNVKIELKKMMKKHKFFIIDGIVSDDIYDYLLKKHDIYSIYIRLDKTSRIKRIMERENLTFEEAENNLNIKDNIKISCGLDIITSKCNAIVESNKELNACINEVLDLIENTKELV